DSQGRIRTLSRSRFPPITNHESPVTSHQSPVTPMRADFYLIAKPRFRDEPLRLVCELARKAHDAGLWTLVLARDAAQAEALDDLLWDMGDDAYIPHQIAGADADEEEAAVLIAPPEVDAPLRPLVINLRDAAVEGAF